MAVSSIDPKTTANFVTDNANALPLLWDTLSEKTASSINPLMDLMGPESGTSPFIRKDDLAKGNGETINIRTHGGIYGEGRHGESTRTGFGEKLPTGGYQLTVDWVWNGDTITKKAKGRMGLFTELDNIHRKALSKWHGWNQTNLMLMVLLYKSAARNLMYANRKGARTSLVSADTLGIDEIKSAAHRIKSLGGTAAMVGKSGKNPIWKFFAITPSEACLTLKNSSDYNNALQNAGKRGDENYIFGGGYPDIDGNIILEFNAPDHEGLGPVASPLTPKAFVGVAITAGTAATDITGGGTATNGSNTTALWFRWFSKFQYKFSSSDTLSAGSGDRYVLIVNPDGTYGMCSYTTNNGNKLPIVKRLAASAVGINDTTVGSVIYGTSAGFTNTALLTQAFSEGATIVECSAKGVPIARTIVVGGHSMLFGYGSPKLDGSTRFNPTMEEQEHGMFIEYGMEAVYGAALCARPDGVIPNVMIIEHAAEYDALALPTVT